MLYETLVSGAGHQRLTISPAIKMSDFFDILNRSQVLYGAVNTFG
jgi:hypothetical protein